MKLRILCALIMVVIGMVSNVNAQEINEQVMRALVPERSYVVPVTIGIASGIALGAGLYYSKQIAASLRRPHVVNMIASALVLREVCKKGKRLARNIRNAYDIGCGVYRCIGRSPEYTHCVMSGIQYGWQRTPEKLQHMVHILAEQADPLCTAVNNVIVRCLPIMRTGVHRYPYLIPTLVVVTPLAMSWYYRRAIQHAIQSYYAHVREGIQECNECRNDIRKRVDQYQEVYSLRRVGLRLRDMVTPSFEEIL